MNKKVLNTISDHNLLKEGDTVIVALSGGADSVSLLHVLLHLRDELGITLMAAHVNHKLRGEESERDELFVRDLCDKWGVQLFVHTADVAALALERGESIELCGREVRYAFFSKLSEEHNAKIATAHTLSDSEETMLYNIARGTTLHGLCSIPYKRDYIVRPLLDVSRCEIEQYCEDNSLEFVEDSTNFQEDVCKRNKLRLSVFPPLRKLSDGFDRNFSRLRTQLLSVDRYMTAVAENAIREAACPFGLDAKKLLSLDDAVLGYVLMQYISSFGATAEYRHIALCQQMLRSGGAVCLPEGYTALCTQGVFRVIASSNSEDIGEIPFRAGLSLYRCGKECSTEELSKDEIVYKKLARSCVACDKIKDSTVLRTRREGDTFTPLGRGITKPLRKLQNELKIPTERRDKVLIVATGSIVLWAEDIGVSEHGALSFDSESGICITVK